MHTGTFVIYHGDDKYIPYVYVWLIREHPTLILYSYNLISRYSNLSVQFCIISTLIYMYMCHTCI